MEISKESWQALVDGQIRDRDRIADLQQRLVKMSKQVERLSWMVEYMERPPDEGAWAGPSIEEAEAAYYAH